MITLFYFLCQNIYKSLYIFHKSIILLGTNNSGFRKKWAYWNSIPFNKFNTYTHYKLNYILVWVTQTRLLSKKYETHLILQFLI